MSAKMIERSNKLLSDAELRRLRMGSYESRIEETVRAVRAALGDVPFEIVSTRDNGAVVFADEKFLRVTLTEDGPTLSDLDVEVFDTATRYAFVEREAGVVADLFLRGAMKSAVARLENLVPRAAISDTAVARIEAQIAVARPWKQMFEARREFILDFLGDEIVALEEGRLRLKLGKLYDGSIEEGKLDSYVDRVAEVLGIVVGRIEQAHDEVRAAMLAVRSPLSEASEPVVSTFRQFADDLLSDLSALHESSSHAIEVVDDIRARGTLCDTLVEGLHDREVASRFVVVVADRMVEAS